MKPKSLNMFGIKVPIIYKDLISEGYYGRYFGGNKHKIEVDKTLKGSDLDNTILHEACHAYFDRAGLNQTSISYDLQEIICEGMSTWLTENFKFQKK